MIKNIPDTWIGLRKITLRGKIGNLFNNWIRERYNQQGILMSFTLKEIMEAHEMNYEGWRDYHKAISYFMKQRKAIETAMVIFWKSEGYKMCQELNMSEDAIFLKLIETAVSWQVYPMWSDPEDEEHKYKLFDLDSYLFLKKQRAKAIVTEIKRKSEGLLKAGRLFPKAIGERYEKPQLEGDGVFLELPPPERVNCPYDDCDAVFVNNEKLVEHIERKHKD